MIFLMLAAHKLPAMKNVKFKGSNLMSQEHDDDEQISSENHYGWESEKAKRQRSD